MKNVLVLIVLVAIGCATTGKKGKETGAEPPKPKAETFFYDGIEHFGKQEYDAAITSFQEALKIANDDSIFIAEIYNHTGMSYLKKMDYEQATGTFELSTKFNSKSDVAWNNLGYAYFFSKKFKKALAALERALELNPDYTQAQVNHNLTMRMLKGQLNPTAFELFEQSEKLPDLEGKIDNYKKAIQIDTSYAEAYNNLAVAYYQAGHADSAAIFLRKAVKLNSHYPEALNNLGYILDDLGKHKEAVQFYLIAIQYRPNYLVAFNNMAESHYQLKDYPDARRIWKSVLLADPNNMFAKKRLVELEQVWKEPEPPGESK
jgi:tetratricopeptide (TPR) repeat protein